jgi:hypothetical protein
VDMRRMSGHTALFQSALWTVFIAFLLVVNPQVGIAGPHDLEDPARLLPALHDHSTLIIFPGLFAPGAGSDGGGQCFPPGRART